MLRALVLLAAAGAACGLRAATPEQPLPLHTGGPSAATSAKASGSLAGLRLPPIQLRGSLQGMPAIGFGTCCRKTARGPALVESTETFLRLGGRLIDTAQKYQNHKDLKKAIQESGVPREEIWVTSKVNTITQNLTRQGVMQAVDESLQELGLQYLDLMLLHRPVADPALRVEEWRGLIDAQLAGKVRNIGVSNFDPTMIQALIDATGVQPSVNQVSFNPGNSRRTRKNVQWCLDKGIAVTAYASVRDQTTKDTAVQISKSHGATPAQVLLRWALDQGVAVIPGATSEDHIKDNLGTSDFHLSKAEAAVLENR